MATLPRDISPPRRQKVAVHLTDAEGADTGQMMFVVVDHDLRLAYPFETRAASDRANTLPVDIMGAIFNGDADLYRALMDHGG